MKSLNVAQSKEGYSAKTNRIYINTKNPQAFNFLTLPQVAAWLTDTKGPVIYKWQMFSKYHHYAF